jgi:hypothetical protein
LIFLQVRHVANFLISFYISLWVMPDFHQNLRDSVGLLWYFNDIVTLSSEFEIYCQICMRLENFIDLDVFWILTFSRFIRNAMPWQSSTKIYNRSQRERSRTSARSLRIFWENLCTEILL